MNNPFKFELKEKSRRGEFYIWCKYEGGDADTEHIQEYRIAGVNAANYFTKLDVIQEELKKLQILHDLLDTHGENHKYDDILKEHGEDIADMYDNVPNDPQGDYQFKCYLDTVKLVYYNDICDRYETYTDI